MPTHHPNHRSASAEALENRRLLTFLPLGSAQTVPGSTGTAADQHAIASSTNNTAVVAEQSDAGGVTLVRYAADGTLSGSSIRVATDSAISNPQYLGVAVGLNQAGYGVIAYAEPLTSGTSAIFFRTFTPAGALSSPKELTRGAADDPAVAIDDIGHFWVAWLTHETVDSVRVRDFSNDDARPYEAAFTALAAQSAGSTFSHLSIAQGIYDDLVVAVTQTAASRSVRWRQVHTGGPLDDAHTFATPGYESFRPSVVKNNDSSFFIAALEQKAGGHAHGYAQKFSYHEAAQSNVISLAPEIVVQSIAIAPTRDKGFDLVFEHDFSDDRGTESTLYTRSYSGYNELNDDLAILARSSQGAAFVEPAATVDGDQDFDVIYRNAAAGTLGLQRDSVGFGKVDRGTLYVNGTSTGDLSVRQSGKYLTVNLVNNVTRKFIASTISALNIFGGDSGVRIENDTALPATIVGGIGNDTILGGEGNDYILGGAGTDCIAGNGGADTVYGQDDADTLYGNDANDSLNGGAGYDSLVGGPGNDRAAADTIDRFISIEQMTP